MKNHLRRLALLIPSVVVALALVEGIVRALFPQPLYEPRPDIWTTAPTFGYRNVANADTKADVRGNDVHFVTDGNGYRIDTKSKERGCEPEARILMLGDSFLEGLKVEEDETIPVLSSRLLERDHGICALVDNAGVSGWNPNHYYLEARRALEQRHYDVGVVFVYTGNDVIVAEVDSFPPQSPVPQSKFRFPRSLGGGELVDALIKPINDFLRTRSHAYELFKRRIRQRFVTPKKDRYFPEVHRKEIADSPRWRITASVLQKVHKEFDDHGAPVFFVLIPSNYQVVVSQFDDHVDRCGLDPNTVDVDQPNLLLRRECAALGLDVLDPIDIMREKSQQGVDMYSGWDPHFSLEGNAFMSAYISPTIVSLLE